MDTGEYGDAYRDVVSRMGKDGWLALGWPTEYGGQNRSMMDQLIFTDEAAIAGATGAVSDHQLGGADDHALRHRRAEGVLSTEDRGRRSAFLHRVFLSRAPAPIWRICGTTAVTDGDEYAINGQKMWTSLVPYADYIWLACRTDQSGLADGAKKHRGISVLTVPTTAPGFDYTVVHTMSGSTRQPPTT